jgi:hypothetical protein
MLAVHRKRVHGAHAGGIMRPQLLGPFLLAMVTTAMPAAAQAVMEITVTDPNAARATIYGGYGGHGVDWEMAADSQAFAASLVRIRGFVGQGRWVGTVDTHPPAGLDPTVTRAGVLAMVSERPDFRRTFNAYVGLGFAAYIPRGVAMKTQFGAHVVLGLEAIGDGWSIGPELQFDVPHPKPVPGIVASGLSGADLYDGNKLMPTVRIGVAIRKQF